LVQPTAAVAREVFWELADALLAPCCLFDAGDTLLLHRSMLELANSNTEQAAAMQAAFFGSSKVRLMCWPARRHRCCSVLASVTAQRWLPMRCVGVTNSSFNLWWLACRMEVTA
jgi:hypothetical protein